MMCEEQEKITLNFGKWSKNKTFTDAIYLITIMCQAL